MGRKWFRETAGSWVVVVLVVAAVNLRVGRFGEGLLDCLFVRTFLSLGQA